MPEGEREVQSHQVPKPIPDVISQTSSDVGVFQVDSGGNSFVLYEELAEKNPHTPCSSDHPNLTAKASHAFSIVERQLNGVSDEEARVDCRDGEVRRDSSSKVDRPRTSGTGDTAPRGVWHGKEESEAHQFPRDGGADESSQCQEISVATVLPGLGSTFDGQRDHSSTPKDRHREDLREEQPRARGSSGFREGSIPHICRGKDRHPVLHLGQDHMAGGRHMSTTGPLSTMADRGRVEAHGENSTNSFEDHPEQRTKAQGPTEACEKGETGREGRCISVIHHSSLAAADDGTHARGQDGVGRFEGLSATSSKGGQVQHLGGELRQDLSVTALDSQAPSLEQVGSLDTEFTECRRTLTETAARHLEHQSNNIVPQIFQSLVQRKRTMLLEVACSPESVLSSEMQARLGYSESAVRCSHWNGCDLTTGEGVKLILSQIDQLEPLHVWISTECGPFSPMQNLNQRTESQKTELEGKRKQALRQYVGASCVWHYAVQRGIHVSWEWAQKSHAWRLPLIQKLSQKYQPWFSVVNGCQVNLRNEKNQKLLHKGWKVMTTHQRMAQMLDLPCRCPKSTQHAPCEGSMTHLSAFYTKEFAKRVCSAITQEMTHAMLVKELSGESQVSEVFGSGPICVCSELRVHGSQQTCGACLEPTVVRKTDRNQNEQAWVQTQVAEKSKVEQVKKQLYQLHAATGHGSIRHMVEALRKRGSPEYVLELAKQFTCHVCQERSKVSHKHVASLEPLPPKWATICADGGHWIHPSTGEHVEFALVIDEGSRFRAARVMCRGKHKTMNASQFLLYLQEGWCQYFGMPQSLRLDPAGAFRSNEVERFCDRHGIYLDFIPGEAHWKLGACEQAIQGVKELMTKLALEEPDLSAEAALAEATMTFNMREQVRGFSPIQHALGRAPDETGRCLQTLTGEAIEQLLPNPNAEFEQNIERRKRAEQAHAEWNAQQKIVRAMNSRGNRKYHYHPGDLVYYWRKQVSGQHASSQRQKQGCFLGPGRVLATETHREADGSLRPGSSVWIIRGRRLIKCCPEQMRPATRREELLEVISKDEHQKAPWTFQRLTQELGGNEFEDVSTEVPSEEQWRQARDEPRANHDTNHQSRRRILGKRVEGQEERVLPGATRRKTEGASLDDALVTKEPWYERTSESSRAEAAGECYWTDEATAVEIEIPMPTSNREWKTFTNDLESYFIGALKRRAVEVNEKRLEPHERQQFDEAKQTEVKNYIAAKAFEALPPEMRPPVEKAIKMRWLLTWKLKDDGTQKAKARAILLGYQDPSYEERETTSPVMTRQSRQFLLTAAARFKWKVQKGDVTGAFLQGRPYPQELYCIPVDEICEAMAIPPGSITRVRRGCYGLVDAPLEWYRTVSGLLDTLGLVKSWSDPCTWLWKPEGVLSGMISGHVDDFLFAGPADNPEWQALLQKIREHFKWTDWEEDTFIQCGVKVEQQTDGSFWLSQKAYVEKIPEIYVNATRKKESEQATTEREKSQLRATLGALSWYAQQTAPHISAEVGLLLSEVSHSKVETIHQTNKLVHFAKAQKEHKLVIHAIPEHVPVGIFTWCDAAGQNRRDGSSTQGIFVCMGPLSLLAGEVEKVIPLAWHSNKIERQCRSPGAAEGRAAVAGEDFMYHARFQWGEMLGKEVNIFDVDSIVKSVPGCLISDSRNVYDKLQNTEMTIRGAEKKVDLELLCLKHSQRETGVVLRWVHSEAQLGNSLTKSSTKELQMFYNLNFKWRLVSDDNMMSARKRRQQGLEVLEQKHKPHKEQSPS